MLDAVCPQTWEMFVSVPLRSIRQHFFSCKVESSFLNLFLFFAQTIRSWIKKRKCCSKKRERLLRVVESVQHFHIRSNELRCRTNCRIENSEWRKRIFIRLPLCEKLIWCRRSETHKTLKLLRQKNMMFQKKEQSVQPWMSYSFRLRLTQFDSVYYNCNETIVVFQ
jgi:hypothetical protein